MAGIFVGLHSAILQGIAEALGILDTGAELDGFPNLKLGISTIA